MASHTRTRDGETVIDSLQRESRFSRMNYIVYPAFSRIIYSVAGFPCNE